MSDNNKFPIQMYHSKLYIIYDRRKSDMRYRDTTRKTITCRQWFFEDFCDVNDQRQCLNRKVADKAARRDGSELLAACVLEIFEPINAVREQIHKLSQSMEA